ncbi:dehydratase [Nocardioides flavus (ex Wang et al. 2016)]|uniref:Dehydratase n=1 Tax=Nocardioides flavus (ex Wang et al. 2016) TaxID=2058780 RepID=A0ABQ3HMT2_9ACTN|nr:MaoC/PaaZ C-terminal domain-containing protein [Nocardioides flavus (ex Wang et al. 2016)]GHE17717.1 dehydratase [Nocardioides flavus (ex Wang et al. 2016)]
MSGTEWHESPALDVTQAHLDGFAAISGDDNPIHVDPDYAATTAFALPVAHGMFLFSLVRAELRRIRPQARLVEQRLMFPAPTPVGARVRVVLEPQAGETGRERWSTRVVHEDGTVGLTGECVLEAAR